MGGEGNLKIVTVSWNRDLFPEENEFFLNCLIFFFLLLVLIIIAFRSKISFDKRNIHSSVKSFIFFFWTFSRGLCYLEIKVLENVHSHYLRRFYDPLTHFKFIQPFMCAAICTFYAPKKKKTFFWPNTWTINPAYSWLVSFGILFVFLFLEIDVSSSWND